MELGLAEEIVENNFFNPKQKNPMPKEQKIWSFIFTLIYAGLIFSTGYILLGQNRLPTSISTFDLFIVAFATFRLIRLLVYDYIMKYIRDYFEQFQTGPGRTVADLLSCPWCTGVWMALLVAFFYFLTPLAWYPLFLFALAGMGTYLQLIIIRIGHNL